MIPENPSDLGHNIPPTADIGTMRRFHAAFSPDMLSRMRGVISVLLDIGKLIDKGLAMYRGFGFGLPHHA